MGRREYSIEYHNNKKYNAAEYRLPLTYGAGGGRDGDGFAIDVRRGRDVHPSEGLNPARRRDSRVDGGKKLEPRGAGKIPKPPRRHVVHPAPPSDSGDDGVDSPPEPPSNPNADEEESTVPPALRAKLEAAIRGQAEKRLKSFAKNTLDGNSRSSRNVDDPLAAMKVLPPQILVIGGGILVMGIILALIFIGWPALIVMAIVAASVLFGNKNK